MQKRKPFWYTNFENLALPPPPPLPVVKSWLYHYACRISFCYELSVFERKKKSCSCRTFCQIILFSFCLDCLHKLQRKDFLRHQIIMVTFFFPKPWRCYIHVEDIIYGHPCHSVHPLHNDRYIRFLKYRDERKYVLTMFPLKNKIWAAWPYMLSQYQCLW